MGSLAVPSTAYYGIFTERARQNFQISGLRADPAFLEGLLLIKKAAATVNADLGILDRKVGMAIVSAADEALEGKWQEHFILDVFQAGAGTPFNMNCNEVLANVAIEKLGGKRGDYALVHPNNHVNMAQSTNDVIPTTIRIASLLALEQLMPAVENLTSAFRNKSVEYKSVVKTGRTHLQDAVPITFGQEFGSYAHALGNCTRVLFQSRTPLLELGIGGTAVGTGITTHPEFKQRMIAALSSYTGFPFIVAPDSILATWSLAPFLEVSSALRMLAIEVAKICNDLVLLASGPKTGIAEVLLPEVEPGSSIMPGKVNPSIQECALMVCNQVIGNDHAIAEAAKSGQLELNVMTPLVAFDLLWSTRIMTNMLNMLADSSIKGMAVDTSRSTELLEKGLSLVTALNPYIGYEVAAEIVKLALKEDKAFTAVITGRGIMSEQDLRSVLDARAMTQPGLVDKELKARIQGSESFQNFRKTL